MTTITSPHNEHMKGVRKLAQRRERERSGRFVAEGEDLLAAADAAGWPALERYCAAGSELGGVEVEPAVLAGASTLASGTRVLAVYEQRFQAIRGPLCVYLHGVGDPGNLGAVLRAAAAFGASGVVLGPGCADPYGPKSVRASMGAIFSVALAHGGPHDLPGERVALVPGAGDALRGPLEAATLLVGAERDGLPANVVAGCDRSAHIPIHGDSLNAAMAATVALYEATRMPRP